MSKLSKLRAQYGIPETPYLPMGKVVLVFRMPEEEKTAGGLFIPGTSTEPKPYGIIVAAGLQAREIMRDALIDIGDTVWFGRFEGWEKEIERENASKGKYLLQMKVDGLLGSVEAIQRLENDYEIVDDEDGDLRYERRARSRKAS